MASVLNPRTLDLAVAIDTIEEFRHSIYDREVLQLDQGTEEAFDSKLASEAEALGIEIPAEAVKIGHAAQTSLCESSDTTISGHARSGSSGSQESASTELTSEDEGTANGGSPILRTRSGRGRSRSFGEYDRYLAHTAKQSGGSGHYAHLKPPPEPAPSLFSVSTRKSYSSIKSSIKARLRLRKNTASMEDLK
jgi:hypothetical protein